MIASVLEIFSVLIRSLFEAGQDQRRIEDAMMAAEEKLSRARARAKFGVNP